MYVWGGGLYGFYLLRNCPPVLPVPQKPVFVRACIDEVSTRRKIPVCKSKEVKDKEQTSVGTPSVVRECVHCKKRFAIFPFG